MKKLILLVSLVMIAIADIHLIDSAKINQTDIDVVCIDGYKFIIIKDRIGLSVVQQYEARGGTKPARPIECD